MRQTRYATRAQRARPMLPCNRKRASMIRSWYSHFLSSLRCLLRGAFLLGSAHCDICQMLQLLPCSLDAVPFLTRLPASQEGSFKCGLLRADNPSDRVCQLNHCVGRKERCAIYSCLDVQRLLPPAAQPSLAVEGRDNIHLQREFDNQILERLS